MCRGHGQVQVPSVYGRECCLLEYIVGFFVVKVLGRTGEAVAVRADVGYLQVAVWLLLRQYRVRILKCPRSFEEDGFPWKVGESKRSVDVTASRCVRGN